MQDFSFWLTRIHKYVNDLVFTALSTSVARLPTILLHEKLQALHILSYAGAINALQYTRTPFYKGLV